MKDLNSIADHLVEIAKNKSIVLLGESSHGVHEFNLLRNLFIEKLHDSLGFKIVMIESISEPQIDLGSASANELVRKYLHEAYQTKELISLFEIAQKKYITLSGFEICGRDLEAYREMKKQGDGWRSRSFRDEVMYKNFSTLMESVFYEQKVIVWAHNNHIMKKTSPAAARSKVLGEYLYDKFGNSLLTVGQYAAAGDFEHMPGEKVDFSELPKNSLNDLILQEKNEVTLLDQLMDSNFDKEMPTIMGSGKVEVINPAKHFDALVLHRTASAAWRI